MEAVPNIPADILAGPSGGRVGAFFDLDGTLVQGFTAAVHLGHRIRHRQARFGELTGTVEAALRYRFGRMKFEHLLSRAGGYLRGESLDELHELGSRLYVQRIESRVHAEMRDVVAAHRQAGHTLVMCSSAMTMHAAPIADALAIPHVICNRFDVDTDGRLTGAIVRPIIWGTRKARAVLDRAPDRRRGQQRQHGDDQREPGVAAAEHVDPAEQGDGDEGDEGGLQDAGVHGFVMFYC